MLKLHNTLTRITEEFKPLVKGEVSLYTCGPTVYHFAHIGNLRTYIFEDLLRRVLEFDGYKVHHAMNITDVGHLVGDADDGEDKMEVGAKREGIHPLDVAKRYEAKFFHDLKELSIEIPTAILRATDAISEQIGIIKLLEEKGFIYSDEFAIYFDTSKLPDYGKLSGQKLSDKKTGARDEVIVDSRKKNPADFALWFFLKGRYENHILQWESPWGAGFPGWHIECSAIARKLLGQPFDIHTGGVDHIGTHHTNEIAQSEAAFGVPLANVWMHGEFLLIDNGRMGKSQENFLTIDTLKNKGFSALDYRYMCLQAHYRTQLNFTWEVLEAAHKAFSRLVDFIEIVSEVKTGSIDSEYKNKFIEAVNEDLNIPKALGIMWDLIGNSTLDLDTKKATILEFDRVFGLDLKNHHSIPIEVPEEIQKIALARVKAKESKDFTQSDDLRKQIEELGYEVMDTPEGQKVKKKIQI